MKYKKYKNNLSESDQYFLFKDYRAGYPFGHLAEKYKIRVADVTRIVSKLRMRQKAVLRRGVSAQERSNE